MASSINSFASYTSLNKESILFDVKKVNALRNKYASFSDEEITNMTNIFRERLRNGETIEDIKVEALAVAREAIYRKLGKFPYNTQIEAASAMSDNVICEMKTGEGKTLVQILSSYLYALEATKDEDRKKWESVHILTANEYLASRDKTDNESVFKLLGLSCGYAPEKSSLKNSNYRSDKMYAYSCDIVYATASTVAFDYLDDNHAQEASRRFITKKMNHAIIDEADDILLDQATTPLIITGSVPGMGNLNDSDVQKLYEWATKFINEPKPLTCKVFDRYNRKTREEEWTEDCALFKDKMMVVFSERLYKKIYGSEQNLKDINVQDELVMKDNAVTNAILAKFYYTRGDDYILERKGNIEDKDGKEIPNYRVSLIGEFTGRILENTTYMDGIQEAIEAKEAYLSDGYNVSLNRSTFDIAKCTYPDFMSQYTSGVSGMTGTSDAEDFDNIYKLQTYVVDSRKPNIRIDEEREVYVSKDKKYKAILKEIMSCEKSLQPVLVGTTSINESDEICAYLDKAGIRYQRLDAVNKDNEDDIKYTAGLPGMVTVATNMAGRGIDIKIDPVSLNAGGLYVIGVSKNANERIDRQLIGRAARGGEPGRSKYFQSLDDELVTMNIDPSKISFYKKIFEDKDSKITNKSLLKLVDKCQLHTEGRAKQARRESEEIAKRVFSVHKNKIYEQRNEILDASLLDFAKMLDNIINGYVDYLFKSGESLDKISHLIDVRECYDKKDEVFKANIKRKLQLKVKNAHGMQNILMYMKETKKKMLNVIDTYWISHMEELSELEKSNLYISQFSSENPFDVYERKANKLFVEMNPYIQNEILTYAIHPEYVYGTYQIKNNNEDEFENEMEGKSL